MNFPPVKGWVPFRSNNDQKKEKSKAESDDQSIKVDIPVDWKDKPFQLEDNPHKRLFAESNGTVLFPKALSTYIKEVFPLVQKSLQEHHIKAEIDLVGCEMAVRTTPKTFDPVMILRAHSVIQILARFVPVEDALTLMDEEHSGDIVSISHRKKDTLLRRKERINNDEIKELMKEVLDCKIFVSGKSIAIIGPHHRIIKARLIITDCFERNIHPIYHLKRFQIMNKLEELPEMAGKDWSNYLPPIPKKKNVQRKEPHKVRSKKEYTAFPPAQPESKIDKELASGVFHLKYEKTNGSKRFKLKETDKETPAKKRKLSKNND